MYKSRRRDEPKTTFVRDMIVIVFILCLLTLVALQFHNVMSWCGPPAMPHEYIMVYTFIFFYYKIIVNFYLRMCGKI